MPSDGMMRAAGSDLESSWLETRYHAAIGPHTAALRQVAASRPSHAPLVSAWQNTDTLYAHRLCWDSTQPTRHLVGTRTHLLIALLFHTQTQLPIAFVRTQTHLLVAIVRRASCPHVTWIATWPHLCVVAGPHSPLRCCVFVGTHLHLLVVIVRTRACLPVVFVDALPHMATPLCYGRPAFAPHLCVFVGTHLHPLIAHRHCPHEGPPARCECPAPTSPGSPHGCTFVLWPARIRPPVFVLLSVVGTQLHPLVTIVSTWSHLTVTFVSTRTHRTSSLSVPYPTPLVIFVR
ncbi:hypothetical protein B0H14DRAFT_3426178 [Mycena olivaceomarginata]|nr:hypothetical protein B0H14DRAFT_3426178 [Mycena olivaceomarginata]